MLDNGRETSLGLTDAQVDGLFPFHLAIGREGQILRLGSLFTRLAPHVVVGAPAAQAFRLREPNEPLDPLALRTYQGRLVVLEVQGSELMLKGQVEPIVEGGALFVGTPCVADAAQFRGLGIGINDLPPHNAIADHLFLLQMQQTSLSDMDRLNGKLQKKTRAHATLLSGIPDLIVQLNAEKICINFKPSEEVKLVQGSCIGRSLKELLPADVAERVEQMIAVAGATRSSQFLEFELASEKRHYEVRVAASGSDESVVIVRDTTQRKEIERDLISAREANEAAMKLLERSADVRRVLDSVDQGLLTVTLDGIVEAERSARVDDWFQNPPEGTTVWDLFREASETSRIAMQMGWEQLSNEWLPLELLIDQLPARIQCGARTFQISYRPIAGEGTECARMLVVISDVTAATIAERTEAIQKDLLRVIERTMRDREGVVQFLREADSLVIAASGRELGAVELKRHLHTLKGNCSTHGIQSIADLCHELESIVVEEGCLGDAQRKELATRWANLREHLDGIVGNRTAVAVSEQDITEVVQALLNGERRGDIAERVASWILSPVETALERLGERAKDLARRLDKDIEVRVENDGMRLDGKTWGPFWAALVHAVNNALDHGFEEREERGRTKKPERGALVLAAHRLDDEFVVTVADDGRGIDWASIGERMRERGLPASTRDDLLDALFLDGLTTAEELSSLSGRGVGLGALREVVRGLGGHIDVASSRGVGTVLSCIFPLSSATSGATRLVARTSYQAA